MSVLSLTEIEAEPEGSDIYGLIERIAYKFYLQRRPIEDNSVKNWSDSQRVVADAYWPHIFRSTFDYHRALEWTADRFRKESGANELTSWYMAQDYWAGLVFD